MTNHVRLDFDGVPVLSSLYIDNGSNHLWHDDAVSQMSFDCLWFLTIRSFLFGFPELFDESVISLVDSVSESSSLSGSQQLYKLIHWVLQEFLQLNTSVDLLLEGLLFLLCFSVNLLSSFAGHLIY